MRHVWRGYAHYDGTRWPERWVVYVVQARDVANSRWDYHVRAELRGVCRPLVYHPERGWLEPRFLPGPAGVFIDRGDPWSTLGRARAEGLRLAQVLMHDRWRERRL